MNILNEQRKKDLELLESGHRALGMDPSIEFTVALSRQLLAMIAALRYLDEHGETVRQALDAEAKNHRSNIELAAVLAAFRACPRLP